MTRLYRFLQTMLEQLAICVSNRLTPSTEPQVFRRKDRDGNVYFEIYDPVTGKSNAFGSEREIRACLDLYRY